jgi:hypothetical protein
MSAAANESGDAKLPNIESHDDSAETRLEYGPSRGLPWWLSLIWLTFMTAAVIYVARLYIPDFTLWLGH